MKDKTYIITSSILLILSIFLSILSYKSGYDFFVSITVFIPFLIFNYWNNNFRLTDKERENINKKTTYLIKKEKSYLNLYNYFIYKKNNYGVYILMDIIENKIGINTLEDAKNIIDNYTEITLEEHFYEPNNK